MAFSFFGVFFPFPFLQPMVRPRNLPEISVCHPRSLEDSGKRGIYICWHVHVVTIYPVWGNFACDTSKAQLGNACGSPSETKLPVCPSNTIPESRVGFVWQNLHPFSRTPFRTLGHHSASAGRPPEPRIKRNKTQLRMTPSPTLAHRCSEITVFEKWRPWGGHW